MSKKRATDDAAFPNAPAGFESYSDEKPIRWISIVERVPILGELLSREPNPSDENRFVYRFRVSQKQAATQGSGEDKEDVILEPREIGLLDEKWDLQKLLPILNHPTDRFEVWILPVYKEEIGGGQTAWRFRINRKAIGKKDVPF
jgi:hypothetical protein